VRGLAATASAKSTVSRVLPVFFGPMTKLNDSSTHIFAMMKGFGTMRKISEANR
jgi:hypothetical protein